MSSLRNLSESLSDPNALSATGGNHVFAILEQIFAGNIEALGSRPFAADNGFRPAGHRSNMSPSFGICSNSIMDSWEGKDSL